MAWKVEAQGDTLYINEENLEDARLQLTEKIGKIPEKMLKWTEVTNKPKDEEWL